MVNSGLAGSFIVCIQPHAFFYKALTNFIQRLQKGSFCTRRALFSFGLAAKFFHCVRNPRSKIDVWQEADFHFFALADFMSFIFEIIAVSMFSFLALLPTNLMKCFASFARLEFNME